MQAYHAQTSYRDEHERIITVRSSLCSYQIGMEKDWINISGPGVRETAERESFPAVSEPEDLAILAVILFEDGSWPEE